MSATLALPLYLSVSDKAGRVQGQPWAFHLDRSWSISKAARQWIDNHWVPSFGDPLSFIVLVDRVLFVNTISIRISGVIFFKHFWAFQATIQLLPASISPERVEYNATHQPLKTNLRQNQV